MDGELLGLLERNLAFKLQAQRGKTVNIYVRAKKSPFWIIFLAQLRQLMLKKGVCLVSVIPVSTFRICGTFVGTGAKKSRSAAVSDEESDESD